MKLFGNNKNSKHADVGNVDAHKDEFYDIQDKLNADKASDKTEDIADEIAAAVAEIDAAPAVREKGRRRGKRMRRGEKIAVTVVVIFCVLVLLLIAVYAFYVKPPDVATDLPENDKQPSDNVETVTPDDKEPTVYDEKVTERKERNKYTFLIVGRDRISGCTDTMMVATFDAISHKLNVVSIPRDTLVNVEYSNNKKINALYNRGGINELKDAVAGILGFNVDFYVAIDLNAFVKLVDAIGGVRYNVPVNMHYEDPEQNLYIHVSKGEQLLDGATAVQVVRFRKGYSDQDIGRINTQQDFLMAAAGQMLDNVDDIPISTLASIITEDVDTDLTYGNIIWFAKEAIKMKLEDIKFQILPGNYEDAIWLGKGYASYVTIYVDEWLELLNDFINPYDRDITVKDLDILTRDSSGKLYATSGVKKGSETWGMGKRPSSTSNKNTGGSTSNTAQPGANTDNGNGTENSAGGTANTPAEPAA